MKRPNTGFFLLLVPDSNCVTTVWMCRPYTQHLTDFSGVSILHLSGWDHFHLHHYYTECHGYEATTLKSAGIFPPLHPSSQSLWVFLNGRNKVCVYYKLKRFIRFFSTFCSSNKLLMCLTKVGC